MTANEKEVDEGTKRIDARGNTGKQTNINVEGDYITIRQSPEIGEHLQRITELQEQEIKN